MRWLLAIGMAAATFYSFTTPPAAGFQQPEMARIIFFHLPCAFLASAWVIATAWMGLRSLTSRTAMADAAHAAALEMSVILLSATLATGIVFSHVQWGLWWQKDPRQTSFLLVWLLAMAGIALRTAVPEERARAAASAAYSVASTLPILFLIFVYPRLPSVQQQSFHPTQTISGGGFDSSYWTGILAIFVLLGLTTIWAYRQRIRAAQLSVELDNLHGNLEITGGGTADSGVVRPVPLSTEHGSEPQTR
jgi:heme exporter protein C